MTPLTLKPGERIDCHKVLGRGGMAEVYRVRHAQLDTETVLKVANVNAAERLLLEGQVRAKLKHPSVVRVTDVLDVNGAPALLMALVAGPSLGRALAHGRLSLA